MTLCVVQQKKTVRAMNIIVDFSLTIPLHPLTQRAQHKRRYFSVHSYNTYSLSIYLRDFLCLIDIFLLSMIPLVPFSFLSLSPCPDPFSYFRLLSYPLCSLKHVPTSPGPHNIFACDGALPTMCGLRLRIFPNFSISWFIFSSSL